MKRIFFVLFFYLLSNTNFAQPTSLYLKSTLKENRDKLYRNLVRNTINKNLSLTLTDSTEDNWQDAFGAIELINYKSPWVEGRLQLAMDGITSRSARFQRALIELAYSNYPDKYYQSVKQLLMQADDAKIFAMCAAYILQSKHAQEDANFLSVKTKQQLAAKLGDPILEQLLYHINNLSTPLALPSVKSFLQKSYLPGRVLLISFQRKNRNYPGLVIIRDVYGNVMKDSTGQYFSVPQLARSLSNLPHYLTNGSTPQGIFRMKGYEVSRASFIGPTVNVQLTMPFEKSPAHFYADSAITDTTWNINDYRKLLPKNLKDYYPIYQSYYAGKAGRTEIIIHGTAINPAYYKSQPYYPLTPTMGCLTSKEIWNEETGQRLESDQQKLINAMIPAGGAQGYTIVININDEQRPVLLYDIIPLLEKAGHK